MVTKQQQLEWLATQCDKWPSGMEYLLMSDLTVGLIGGDVMVTRQEWQQERDKMSGKPELDNSWHERGELPPVGCECSAMRDGNWVKVEVLRHRVNNVEMNVAAVMNCASFNVFWATDFRPLRTEREKAIDEIAALVRDGLVSPEMAKEFAIKMYDAGLKVVKR